MPIENYDFKVNRRPSFFNFLLLSDGIRPVTDQEDFDSSNLSILLQINGVDVSISDFNDTMNGWSHRIKEQIRSVPCFEAFEAEVERRAREIIKERLGNTLEVLAETEHSLSKLKIPE